MRKAPLIIYLISLITYGNSVFTQDIFMRWDSIQVVIGNKTLRNPWAGGLNNPQFSPVDFDGDGIKDLFVFDRSRSIPLTFRNSGANGQVDYTYAPEFRASFPPIHSWALLADYNGDGKEDLFTSYRGISQGIKVYKNTYNTTNGLQFTLANPHLTAMDSTTEVDIYVSEWDIPGIADIDGDGDLDILTFDFAGSFMQFFKNVSVENYGNSDSLEFVHEDKCWGNFEEDFAYCSVTLNVPCRQQHGGLRDGRHAGSTILPIDLDGDHDKEVVIGDIICSNVYMLTNAGDSAYANMSAYLPAYPQSHIVDIPKFPATFCMDADNDGLKDFLAAPNALQVSENYDGMWFYKNTGSNATPVFIHQTDSFLVSGMIEVGEGAYPAFFDYNADSLPDLVIGNYGYYTSSNPYTSELALFENTGTRETPAFRLITRDFAGVSSLQALDLHPAFGDMDNDGDEDMILGEKNGHLFYFQNIAGAGNMAVFSFAGGYYHDIDVGSSSAPQIVDVNKDWKPDLLIGEADGTLNYFENTGTAANPAFSSTPTIEHFGGVDVKTTSTGYSSPALIQLDTSGAYTLLVGSERGQIFRYDQIDNNLYGTFTLTDTMFEGISEGMRMSLGSGDLNLDGATDLVIGNYGGGIALYKNLGDSLPPPVPPEPEKPFAIHIYPNPAVEYLHISIDGTGKNDWAEVMVYDLLGNLVYNKTAYNQLNDLFVHTKVLADGIYFCKVIVHTELDVEDNMAFLKFAVL